MFDLDQFIENCKGKSAGVVVSTDDAPQPGWLSPAVLNGKAEHEETHEYMCAYPWGVSRRVVLVQGRGRTSH